MQLSTTNGLLLAGTMLAAAAYIVPAKAADLGGNCCADLEERIAELEATTVRKGNRRVSVQLSGHVSESMIFWDTDNATLNNALGNSPRVTDHDYSASRFRIRGQAQINGDWSAGYLIEVAVPNSGELTTRHNALWIKSKSLGTFWLGQTSSASDGVLEINLAGLQSGLALGSLGNTGALLAGANFGGGGITLNADIRPLWGYDGSRTQNIRYISPTVAGFVLSASYEGDGSEGYDVSLKYAAEFGAIRVAAGAFHRDEGTSNRRVNGGSASLQHVPSGLFVTGALAQSTGPQTVNISVGLGGVTGTFPATVCNCDGDFWGVMAGIQGKWNSLGRTTFAGFYDENKINVASAEHTRYGATLEQDIDAAAMSLFLIYEHHDASAAGTSIDGDAVIVGGKIRF